MESITWNATVLFRILVVVMASNLVIMEAYGAPRVPCYFIFGDSLADNGNNNLLETLAKVDYSPYGIDFPGGPTGRFCNGRTIVDLIAEMLRFDRHIPPFATANDIELLSGVNYASGAAGILDESGSAMGEIISFNKQLKHHGNTTLRLSKILGSRFTAKYLNKCLYSVGMGNNNYVNNYFVPEYYSSSKNYALEQFAKLLIDQYTDQLKVLYGYGARKIVIFGLGKLGCVPRLINASGRNSSDCVETANNAALIFNSKLLPIIDQLNKEFSDAKFIYINNYKIGDNAHTMTDFEVVTTGCWKSNSIGQCIAGEVPCQDRSKYMFWDSYHPTEAFNIFYAKRSYRASFPYDSYPFDIHRLVSLRQEVATDYTLHPIY